MNRKYRVHLTEQERRQLKEVITKGKTAAYRIRHAHILLQADAEGPARQNKDIAQSIGVHENTVAQICRRFVEQGLAGSVERKKQLSPSRAPRFDGAAEARLIALACAQPPEGRSRWTLKLLADKAVELEIVSSVAPETVRQTLKKTRLSHILSSSG